MKLPRLTIRRLMLAVLLVAVALSALAWVERRRARFVRLADEHNRLLELRFVATVRNGVMVISERKVRHQTAMTLKYRAAALHPWLPVAADPPLPPDDSPGPTP